MTEQNKNCPECGGSLPPDALDGACPRCMLAEGLLLDGEEHEDESVGADAAVAGDEDPTTQKPPRPDPPPVEEIAKHFPALAIEGLIGAGGMGIVYRARQTALDRLVALKVLWPELAADPAFSSRFTREARAMARLDHPNIVRVLEFGERDGLCFLVMEHVEGRNLRELLDAGGIRPEEALAIVPQICAALQYAHDQGVVHRDIKPANVLVDMNGRVRIVDFGLAKLVEGDDVTLTRAGQVMGTLHYMAPEQYKSPDDVDHRADIYSLGVVFYEMLTGEVPVGRFEAPSERVQVDVRLDQVVLRSLERKPELRYQNASEVGSAVTSISSGEGPRPVPPVASVPLAAPAVAAAAAPAVEQGPSRISKLAVGSLFVVCLQLVFVLIALAAPPVIVLSIFAAGLAMCMGFVALIRVLGSNGRLHGAGYAFAAIVAPIFVGCGGFLLMGAIAAQHGARGLHGMEPVRIDEEGVTFGEFRIDEDGVRVGDWVQITERGVRVKEPIEIDDRGVRRIPQLIDPGTDFDEFQAAWDVLRRRVAGKPRAVEEVLPFYASPDSRRLAAMQWDAIEKAQTADELGVPMLREPYISRLDAYRVHGVRVDSPGSPDARAWVTVVGDHGELRFWMVREGDEWKFECSPVEVDERDVRRVTTTDADSESDAEAAIATAWAGLQGLAAMGPGEAEIPFSLYNATHAHEMALMTPEEFERARAADLLGVPLLREPHFSRLGEYEVTSVVVRHPVGSANVRVSGERGEIVFSMTREGSDWKFSKCPVSIYEAGGPR